MKDVSAFVLWWSRANLSIILRSYQANFSSLASSYTRILQHQGSKLRKPGWETGRYPYATCQSWRKRNWHTPWDLLGCTWHCHQRQRSTNIIFALSLMAICPQTRQGRASMRSNRVPVMLFPYSILFFNLSNKQVVLLWLRLGVCKPCCHLSWQSSSRVRATAPAFLSCYAPERVFLFQKMFGRCLFPYSQHICSTLTQMACLITVCISRRLNACVVKSRMFS